MRDEAKALLFAGTVIPALPLVLDRNRRLNEAGQRRLVRYYLEAGAGGIAAAVHTTQFAIRDPKVGLFRPVLEIAAQEMDAYAARTGRTVLKIAGVCGPTAQAAKEAALAGELGYDLALLSPGGLGSLSEEELLSRTGEVAKILPVMGFYLQPAVGGRIFSFDYWRRFCEIQGVQAVKSAPFDRYFTLDVARAVASSSRYGEIALYTGNDDNLLWDLLTEYAFPVGGETRRIRFSGGLLGHWAVWTHTAVRYFQEAKRAASGPVPQALLTLAAQITDANAAFFDAAHRFAGCIVGIHEVLRRQGLMEGVWTLDPAETLTEAQSREIDRVYAAYPGLNDDAFVRAFLERDRG